MPFNVRMGVPEMVAIWNDLSARKLNGQLDKNEEKFFKKLVKVLGYLGSTFERNLSFLEMSFETFALCVILTQNA